MVVGGTIAESGIPTIGISSAIDPGNYGHEDTALVLLDLLSAAAPNPNSLNTYLGPRSDKIGFIGRGLGNIITHEIGHYSGNWHTDQFDDTANLMDQGGNIAQMLGVGADGIGGTADDVDVDFTTDSYTPQEPFTGFEDTLDTTAWGYSRGLGRARNRTPPRARARGRSPVVWTPPDSSAAARKPARQAHCQWWQAGCDS
ncbi:hypothetical protein N7U49_40995 [Streptomyces sp. AD2-2]|nr:hypothetical protein N7U49_40995 [Streptomyces sp. AD2-2]